MAKVPTTTMMIDGRTRKMSLKGNSHRALMVTCICVYKSQKVSNSLTDNHKDLGIEVCGQLVLPYYIIPVMIPPVRKEGGGEGDKKDLHVPYKSLLVGGDRHDCDCLRCFSPIRQRGRTKI